MNLSYQIPVHKDKNGPNYFSNKQHCHDEEELLGNDSFSVKLVSTGAPRISKRRIES